MLCEECVVMQKIEKIMSILDFIEENEELQEEYDKYFSMLKKYLKIYYDNNL